MTMRTQRYLACGLVFSLAGCASNPATSPEAIAWREATQTAFASLGELKPGVPEARIAELFQPVPFDVVNTWGIVDLSTTEAEGYTSRVYWIGYRTAIVSPLGYSRDTTRFVAITAVNGVIESRYQP